jgi:Ca-activated chloride channel homolog
MSFASPVAFVGLLLLPVAAIAYAYHERRRRASSEAFASAILRPSVAPNDPGWRRHAPVAMLGLAATALLVAAARPHQRVTQVLSGSAVMLATDVSGSMQATDVKPNRVTAVQRAADGFVTSAPKNMQIGVLEFNQTPNVLQTPTTNRLKAFSALGKLHVGGGTATGNAVLGAISVLRSTPQPTTGRPTRAIVLISDGSSTSGTDPVTASKTAGKLHIPIFTVALGTSGGTITVKQPNGRTYTAPVPPDPALLAAMAKASGGHAYATGEAAQLNAIYKQLGSTLGRQHVQREDARYFVAAGVALVLAALALSLVWFGRLLA